MVCISKGDKNRRFHRALMPIFGLYIMVAHLPNIGERERLVVTDEHDGAVVLQTKEKFVQKSLTGGVKMRIRLIQE